MRDFEQCSLTKRFAQKLQANWELRGFRETARKAYAANARKVARNCKNVRKIHLQRITRFFPSFECGGRSCGSDNGIHLLEGFDEIVSNQRSYLLRTQIESIVIAAAQHV